MKRTRWRILKENKKKCQKKKQTVWSVKGKRVAVTLSTIKTNKMVTKKIIF